MDISVIPRNKGEKLVRRRLGKAFYPVATLLVVSLVGGVAVADSKIGPNRIKDNAIRSRHI